MSPIRGRPEIAALHRHRGPEADCPEEYYQEQGHQAEGRESALGYDQRLLQTRYIGVDSLYDGSEYEGPARFDEGGARSTEHGVFKSQVYSSAVPVDTVPGWSPQQTYGQDGTSPSYPMSPSPQRSRPNYKPTALRWPFLGLLFLAILSFIGLLVYGMHVLPRANHPGLTRRAEAHILRGPPGDASILRTVTPTPSDGTLLPRSASEITPTPIPAPISTATMPDVFSTRPQEDYVDVSGLEPDTTMT